MKIPHSVDDLMWLVAEGQDPSAVESFCSRYPELRSEMLKRTTMIADLRRAKRADSSAIPVLKFRPAPRAPFRATWAVAVVAIASLGLAFAFTRSTPQAPLASTTASTAPVIMEPFVVQKGPEASSPTESIPDPTPKDEPIAPPVVESPKLVTVKLVDVSFQEAAGTVARAGDLKIEIAPGGENMEVRFACKAEPARNALMRLCRENNYTAMEQEPGSFLLIPAVDPNAGSSPMPRDVPRQGDPPIIDR